jgi:thiol:disulfide interchange protein DsbD
MLKRFISSALVVIFLAFCAYAQDPVQWKLTQKTGDTAAAGTSMDVTLSAAIEPGWHLYAIDQPDGGPIKTTIKTAPDSGFEISGDISATEPISKPDPNFIVDDKPLTTKYYQNSASFDLSVKALKDTAFEKLALDARYQACNDTFCLPPKTIRVTSAGSEQVGGLKVSPADNTANTNAAPIQPVNGSPDTGLWGFIWLAATLGLLSLLTPCVFPMIPITISYFTNHSSGSRAKAVRLALVYSLGIIATFTLLGMVLAIFVGAAGINLFAANPWVNLVITAIFLFFAFNLFGAYELTVPSGLLTNLDRLTRSAEGEGSGFVGALLMGLTFTLTSFTCTSPFVGTILVSASQGEWEAPLLGMLVFSAVFALPFFVLALLPQLAAQLPRAGGWMNSVKVSMGFLEVAAAMKFLSNADLVWKWGIFTRNAVLAIWIAIGIILAVYLLGKFQLAHDSKPERIGAVRLVAAILSLAISFYLLTGLFGAKLGELEAFLPPDLSQNTSGKIGGERLDWIMNDYDAALQKAKAEDKPLFVDFTGYTCTNCRWMEANIFTRPEIEAELEKMVLVRLYTDGEGELYERNLRLEEDMFGTVALPYYAIIGGDGKPAASFAGLTRNAEEFQAFLQKRTN